MDNNQNTDFGRSLSDALQDALQSGNFSGLRQTVNSTVHTAVNKTIECVKSARDDAAFLFDWDKPKTPPAGWGPCAWNPGRVWEPPEPKQPQTPQPDAPPPRSETPPKAQGSPSKARRPRQSEKRYVRTERPRQRQSKASVQDDKIPVPPYLKRTGRDLAAGVLTTVAGSLLLLPGGLGALFFLLGMLASGFTPVPVVLFVVTLAVALPGALLLRKGVLKFGRARRFRRYWEQLREKGFCEITGLAAAVEKKPRFVLKDLKRMLDANLFPDGHLDEEKTCLILGDDLYRQYQEARASKMRREQNPVADNAVLAAGLDAVRQIRAANAALPGAIITEKLSRLEDVTANIFEYVERRPAKLQEIRRFMDYYLPTTLKLVKSYQEFEEQPETATIAAAKNEILATLDTINVAFESLLDGLYQDDTLDVSADISVLKTMLAQDGLTGHDFEK